MRRREFVGLLGGAAAWPLVARAQQPERIRHVAVLSGAPGGADDAEVPARIAAFEQGLQQLGWIVGRNMRIDYRWGAGNITTVRKAAAELAVLAPEVILMSGTATLAPL